VGRRPVAITGEAARDRVHILRAQHDAIMVGIGTSVADNPQLTCRLPGMISRSPVRIVLDSQLRLRRSGALAASACDIPLWLIADQNAGTTNEHVLHDMGATILRVDGTSGRLDLGEAMKVIAGRGITRLMVEGGPTVAAALLAADLVDEIALVKSETIIGTDGIDALTGMPLTAITQSPRFRLRGNEKVGNDYFEFYERA